MEDITKDEIKKIKGYDSIPLNVPMFEKFVVNFYNAWGLEARKTIKPLSVKFCRDKANGTYLRFDYEMFGRKEWLHVKNEHTWY